jgi:hypothetical protein
MKESDVRKLIYILIVEGVRCKLKVAD